MEINSSVHKVDIFTTDLYQFTCSYTYFLSKTHQNVATFQVFFRKHPFKGQYAICAGIDQAKEFIKNLSITEQQISHLKKLFPHMELQYFEWLKQNLGKCQLKVKSLKQGQIVFAKQPIITYTGPLAIVQLLQTPLLNLIGFASLIATNANRIVKAASNKPCLQFGARRAQGPDGALSASHYSYLGGFSGTSNVEASMLLDIPCRGTMSHAFITSFKSLQQVIPFKINDVDIVQKALQYRKQLKFNTHDGQLAAFLMYTRAFNHLSALIDTYSTMDSGILNTIIIGKALILAGIKDTGIRLDSGDLCEYSKKVRKIWNKYVSQARLTIVASDDLNEQKVLKMEREGSQIDVYALGTNIATCQKQPALGLVCKLVELNNIPKMKFSQNTDKATYPSKKSIYRIWTKDEKNAKFDLIALEGQQINNNIIVSDSNNPLKKYQVEIFKKIELNKYWQYKDKISLKKSKQFLNQTKETIPQQVFDLQNPKKYQIMMTTKYREVLDKTLNENIILKKLQ